MILPVDKLLKKYNDLSPRVKGSLWFSFATFLQKGLSILATPIFTRIFTYDEYSLYSLYSTWLSIFTVICTFNLAGGVFNTLFHKNEKNKESFLTTTIVFENILTLIVFLFYLGYYFLFGNLSGVTFNVSLLIFANIISNIIFSIWFSKCKYENKFLLSSLLSSLQSLVSFGLSVELIFVFNDRVSGRIVGTIVPILISSLIALWIMLKKKELGKFSFSNLKDIILIASPLVLHYLAQDILSQSDRLFLNQYCTSKEVSIYSLVYSMSLLLSIVCVAFDSAYIPWFYKKIDMKDFSKVGKVLTAYTLFLSLLVTSLCLLGPEIIYVFGGDKYTSGSSLIPILASTVIALMFYDVYATLEFYYRKTFIASLITVVAGGINIGLNAWLIPIYGMNGAAVATLISYAFMAIAHFVACQILIRQKLPNQKVFPTKNLIIISISDITINLLLLLQYDDTALRICLFISIFSILILWLMANRKKIKSFLSSK
jgi:O-antigen/teichoic acid export membrane protein